MLSTPRSWNTEARPAPAHTDTTPYCFSGAATAGASSGSSKSSVLWGLRPAAMSSYWVRMFSILASSSVPYFCASVRAAPGISVWTCTLKASSSSPMTRLSPMEARYARKASMGLSVVLRTMNTVSKVKVMSSSVRAAKSAPALVSPSAGGSMSWPRREESMPSRMVTKPMPPASTTPAFLSTGFWLTVSARASLAASMARTNVASRSAFSAANSAAAAPERRETVRIVPSAGFITAL